MLGLLAPDMYPADLDTIHYYFDLHKSLISFISVSHEDLLKTLQRKETEMKILHGERSSFHELLLQLILH